jgi:hypothetical protein
MKRCERAACKYMMFETSCFTKICSRGGEILQGGGFGKLLYAEGEYYLLYGRADCHSKEGEAVHHHSGTRPIRTAYYVGVSDGSFTEFPAWVAQTGSNNSNGDYIDTKIPSARKVALFRTSEGGSREWL